MYILINRLLFPTSVLSPPSLSLSFARFYTFLSLSIKQKSKKYKTKIEKSLLQKSKIKRKECNEGRQRRREGRQRRKGRKEGREKQEERTELREE
jgi:hypothetical protein